MRWMLEFLQMDAVDAETMRCKLISDGAFQMGTWLSQSQQGNVVI